MVLNMALNCDLHVDVSLNSAILSLVCVNFLSSSGVCVQRSRTGVLPPELNTQLGCSQESMPGTTRTSV